MKLWDNYLSKFKNFLRLEKGLSKNSWEAYLSDLHKVQLYFEPLKKNPLDLTTSEIQAFIHLYSDLGFSERSQARLISSIKNFYRFLEYNDEIEGNPAEIIQTPKLQSKLPDTLSPDEINGMIDAIDLTQKWAYRNKAILEVLYGCGLRVSECVSLRRSHILREEGFIRVIGKGNKERLVPIAHSTLKIIQDYLEFERNKIGPQLGEEDYLFLNQRGKHLTRVMIFYIVRKAASQAGIEKQISPHTFRHSFATHLVQNGADLRSVQQMLGHSSIVTTEIYTHLDNSFLKGVVDHYHPLSLRGNLE